MQNNELHPVIKSVVHGLALGTGRKLADPLHDAMEFPTAEVKYDGAVETVPTKVARKGD